VIWLNAIIINFLHAGLVTSAISEMTPPKQKKSKGIKFENSGNPVEATK